MKIMKLICVLLCAVLLLACSGKTTESMPAAAGEHAGHGEHGDYGAPAETAKGVHGGRLLLSGDIQLELKIFEDGVPPEYRAWVARAGKVIAPEQVQLQVQLARLGGVTDSIEFAVAKDSEGAFLRSTSEVREPHSFDVTIALSVAGAQHRWQYESYEGRTRISAEAAAQAGVKTAVVGVIQIGRAHV